MSELIDADPEAIRAAVDALSTASTDMDTELGDLTSELDFLMTLWTGEASEAYRTAQAGWLSSMNDIHSTLLTMTNLLSTIATRYEDTESNVIRMTS